MTQQFKIKTLSDGSIDYAHYIAISHVIRCNDAHQARAAIGRMIKAGWMAIRSYFRLGRNSISSHDKRHPPGRAA